MWHAMLLCSYTSRNKSLVDYNFTVAHHCKIMSCPSYNKPTGHQQVHVGCPDTRNREQQHTLTALLTMMTGACRPSTRTDLFVFDLFHWLSQRHQEFANMRPDGVRLSTVEVMVDIFLPEKDISTVRIGLLIIFSHKNSQTSPIFHTNFSIKITA